MPRPLHLLAGLVLCLWASMAAGALENRLFDLQHRRAEDVIAQLRELYGSAIQLSANGQTLVVRATPERLTEIEALLPQIDQPPRQVRLTLREGTLASRNGFDGRPGRVYSTTRDALRSVTVQDQQSARIASGQITRAPVAARGGWNPAVVLEEVDQTSGFLVQPTVLSDDQVELRITAIRNQPASGRLERETANITTVRRVRAGEWVELGAEQHSTRTPETSRVFSSRSRDDRVWELQAEVLPAPASPDRTRP